MACRANSVLANISRELAKLAETAEGIDGICAELAPRMGALDKEYSVGLQSIDVLRQSLECLSVLIGNLAEQDTFSEEVPVELLKRSIYLEHIKALCT